MTSLVHTYAYLLRCPDDQSVVRVQSNDFLECKNCSRTFAILAHNCIELLPKEPYKPPSTYQNAHEERFFAYYNQLSHAKFKASSNAIAWGAPERISVKAHRRKLSQIAQLIASIKESGKESDSIVCDVSAGAGYFSLPLSASAKLVVNCDLDVTNLNYVMNKATRATRNNILFVRCDLFASPFAENCFDTMICTDTLIYGDLMARRFLSAIVRSLANNGIAWVDFYNRLHRNPFHAPYMVGYMRRECERFLDGIECLSYSYQGFHQELGGKLWWLIPATRHIFRLSKVGVD